MKRLSCLLLFLFPFVLSAQTTFQEQADRLQNINAFLLDFRPGTAPVPVDKGRFELAFELAPQPSVNTRVGNKDEPVDPPSIVPRLRARYLSANGFLIGGTATPGIEFMDYKAETVSFELGYRFSLANLGFQVRASYSDGDVEGPITEKHVKDQFTFTNNSFDLACAKSFGRFHFYAFLGYIDIETELDIESDGVHLTNTEDAGYGGLGLTWDWRSLGFTLEQNFTDDYLQNVMLSAAYRF